MAIEDAVVLARRLRDLGTPAVALAGYERLRRARVERIVKFGARSSSGRAAGPVGRVPRDAILPRVLKRAGTPDWMYDYHVDWDARWPDQAKGRSPEQIG